MGNIFGILKYVGIAWKDKAQVEHLVEAAKVMEGPKPSWKTGEYWINQVLPILGGMVGAAASVVSAPALTPYFIIAVTVIAVFTYLGRQWLKVAHLGASKALDLSDPATMAQITAVVQNVSAAVHAMKEAKSGNTDAATKITETLNAPDVTVNVNK